MKLLSIIELGGYPNFEPLYKKAGYEVTVARSMRKAMAKLKRMTPQVIVAEYNFQSDFRDRTSNLETLLAKLQAMPDTRLVVFYEKEFAEKFAQVQQRFDIRYALMYPIDEQALSDAIRL